ncbi:MAG: polysaccharide biosynthesis C-terminal domain-containing protein [Chloroflexi bacterium]|nr:polysaccharide biosynthesis C-terminal domain-containing protein [Chloroflexota bacterium]
MATSERASKKQRPLVERAGRAVFWNAAFFPLKMLISVASSVVLTRGLRLNGFYLFTIALVILDSLGLFADLGIERTLPRFLPEIEMRYGRRGINRFLLWVTAVKGVVLLALIAALVIGSDYWIKQFSLGANGGWLIFFVIALLALGAAWDVSVQLLYTHFKQKTTNTLDVIVAVIRPSLTALFVLAGYGAPGALLALLLTTVISVALSLLLAWRLLKAMPEEAHPNAARVRKPSTRTLRSRIASFAALNYIINWSVYLYDLDFVALAIGFILVGPDEKLAVVLISLAYKFAKEFLRGLVVPLTGVQTPLFSRLYAEGRIEGLRTAYVTLTKFLILALMPAGVGLIFTARNILQILYGQKGSDAVLTPATMPTVVACTAILTFGLFGEAIISVSLNVLMVYEEYRAVISARLVSLISIPLLLLLVPPFGAVGAALAVAVSALGSRSLALLYALRKLNLPFPQQFFTKVGAASAVMGTALLPFLALSSPTLPLLMLIPVTGVMIAVGAAVFLAVFKAMGGMEREDKERISSLRLPFVGAAMRFL